MLGLICMKRVIADDVTNMLMIQILIKKTTHYQQVTAIHFTDPWDRGMGCQRGMVEWNIPRDGMDSRTHMHL